MITNTVSARKISRMGIRTPPFFAAFCVLIWATALAVVLTHPGVVPEADVMALIAP